MKIVDTNVIAANEFKANINLKVDEDLKERAFAVLEKMGVTPTDVLRQTLEYIVEHQRLPVKVALISEEDAELLDVARQRLRNPRPVSVMLDDL